MFYSFDIADIVDKQLPTRKKGARHLDWLFVLVNSLTFAFDKFTTFRDSSLKELSYNSQTIIFEKMLNDNVDNTLRRIFVDNTFDNTAKVHLVAKGEDAPTFLFDISEGEPATFLRDPSEFIQDFDFTIFVPVALTDQETLVRALANKFKMSGIEYTIVFY